jgi:hypothetical protein
VFQLVVVRKSLERTLQRAQKYGSRRVLNRDCREDEGEQSTPLIQLPPLCADWCAVWRYPAGEDMIHFLLGRTILIRCFNFFSVCTYCPELIVTPLSKNSTDSIPGLLAITLPAEVSTLNIFLRDDDDTIPLTVFSSVGRNEEPRFHHL